MKLPRLFSLGGRHARESSSDQLNAARDAVLRETPAPTIWLFGKTGSGKSSVVKLLTEADEIAIGNGFRPTTRQTDLYEFPDPDMPVMRFLDTRGLGEPGYDAAADIAELQQRAHALIVTHRLVDFAHQTVIGPLRILRKAEPDRPLILALTCLHQAYPQQPHPPYPFTASLTPAGLDDAVLRAIQTQQHAFDGLVDRIVPIDLTRADEGFDPPDYGGAELRETLVELLPSAYRHALRSMAELLAKLKDLHERAALPYIHSAAHMAAAAALAPLPWVDIPVVGAIQTRMVYAIARVYNQQGSVGQLLELLAAAGMGFAARLGVRELLKVVPYVGTIAGGVLGAALGYSYTYAMGKVCCWYYARLRAGHEPTSAEMAHVFREKWKEGKQLWKSTRPRQDSR